MKVQITENQYKAILNEFYDPEKLYRKDFIVDKLKAAPKYMRGYIKGLQSIDCQDAKGNPVICTYIPEVVYQYIFGNF